MCWPVTAALVVPAVPVALDLPLTLEAQELRVITERREHMQKDLMEHRR